MVYMKGMRQLGHYDLTTGEVLPNVNLYAIAPKRRNGFGRWLAMSQDNGVDLAVMHRELGSAGYAALWYVIGIADFENKVAFTKADAAAKLEMLPSAFSRAFKRLVTAGLVREAEKIGNTKTYVISPEVVWRGSSRNHHAALKAWRQRKGE